MGGAGGSRSRGAFTPPARTLRTLLAAPPPSSSLRDLLPAAQVAASLLSASTAAGSVGGRLLAPAAGVGESLELLDAEDDGFRLKRSFWKHGHG